MKWSLFGLLSVLAILFSVVLAEDHPLKGRVLPEFTESVRFANGDAQLANLRGKAVVILFAQ